MAYRNMQKKPIWKRTQEEAEINPHRSKPRTNASTNNKDNNNQQAQKGISQNPTQKQKTTNKRQNAYEINLLYPDEAT